MKKFHSFILFFLTAILLLSSLSPAWAVQAPGEEPLTLSATAAILVDADYGEILYEYQADEVRYPAAITKVMTALLAVEAISRGELAMDTQVTLGSDIYTGVGEGGATKSLSLGEILTVQDLLNYTMLLGVNEACNALAIAVDGSVADFVERMNTRGAELGMTGTHFTNTHGYYDNTHFTTARDIARMCQEAIKHSELRTIMASASYTLPDTFNAEGTQVHASRTIYNTNRLITAHNTGRTDLLYKYAIGIKTGSTPESGYCLAAAAEKGGRTMISVLLGGKNYESKGQRIEDNYFSESRKLLEYGFTHFSRKTVLDMIEPIATIPVTLCAEQNYVTVQPAQSITATLPSSLDPSAFDREITLPDTLQAPIQKGEVLGSIHISYQGVDYGTVELVATSGLELSQRLYTLDRIRFWFSKLWVRLALLVLALLILFLILRRALLGPGSRRSRRNRRSGKAPAGIYSTNYRGRKRR